MSRAAGCGQRGQNLYVRGRHRRYPSGHCGVADRNSSTAAGGAPPTAVGLVLGTNGGNGFAKERAVQGFGRPGRARRRLGRGAAPRQGGRAWPRRRHGVHAGLAHGLKDLPEGRMARHGPGRGIRVPAWKAACRPWAAKTDIGRPPLRVSLHHGHVENRRRSGRLRRSTLMKTKWGLRGGGDLIVLEGFVSNNVAPVAGRVAMKAAPARPGRSRQRATSPERLPVRVAGVLAKVRRRVPRPGHLRLRSRLGEPPFCCVLFVAGSSPLTSSRKFPPSAAIAR